MGKFTKFLTVQILILICNAANSQVAPAILWQKCLGGSFNEEAHSIQQTSDGGFIVAGWATSNDGDVGNHYGAASTEDAWVVKLDSNRNMQWQKVLGGTGNEELFSIEQTGDGGYITVGYTDSNDGDVSGNHGGGNDCWVVKLNSNGAIQWQKCLGGSHYDVAVSIHQVGIDGGYVMGGYAQSNDGDVTGNHSSDYDFWLVKLDVSGIIQWQKCLGGSGDEKAFSMQMTSDGGYIMAGFSYSDDGDVSGHHGELKYNDYWIVKLDSNRNIQWQKSFGGNNLELARSVSETKDGGYIVGGQAESVNDGDVTANHGYIDFWVIKLNKSGDIQWQKCFGGSGDDILFSIKPALSGGYIAAGRTTSNDGDVSGNHGGIYDSWIVKLNAGGSVEWQKCIGGTSSEWAWSIIQTSDKGYAATGQTESNDNDVSGNHGAEDFWVVKLAEDSSHTYVPPVVTLCNQMYPNPARQFFFIEMPWQEVFSLVIYDAIGRRIYVNQNVSGKFKVDCSRFASGVYFVSAINGRSVHTCKIVKLN